MIIMENPIKMDDLEVPLFQKKKKNTTSISLHMYVKRAWKLQQFIQDEAPRYKLVYKPL